MQPSKLSLLLGFTLVLNFATAACSEIASVDRAKIPVGTGGASGSSTGSGGSGDEPDSGTDESSDAGL